MHAAQWKHFKCFDTDNDLVEMASLNTPQSQAGVLSFYDAPERGPQLNVKIFLAVVVIFIVLVLVLDHAAIA